MTEQKWGDFTIIQKIGQGGMGVVFKAYDLEGRTVALKMIKGGQGTEAIRRRFIREAKATSTLNHVNIIPVYQIDKQDDYSYFTMKYLEGGSFSDMLDEPFLEKKIHIIEQIARALDYAHKHQILHRDVKPSNILFDKEGQPYLTDFGLAKMLDSESNLTQTGQTLGTPFYMAPEQVKGKKDKFGPHCDIYSLGIVLYQALTGKLPFVAETLAVLYQKILDQEPEKIRSIKPDIPEALEKICLRAIDKAPQRRYQSAEQFAEDLKLFLEGREGEIQALKFDMTRTIDGIIRKVLHSPLLVSIIALLFVAGIFLAWHLSKKSEKNTPFQVEPALAHALQTYKKKDYQATLLELAKILDHEPGHKKALWLKMKTFIKAGEKEQLRLVWAQLEETGLTAEEWKMVAEIAEDMGYSREAILYYQKALNEKPDWNECRQALATILLDLEMYRRASIHYQKLINIDTPDILMGRATIYYVEKDYRRALELLQRASSDSRAEHLASQIDFLRAKIIWQKNLPLLSRWQWLLNKKEKTRESEKLEQALITIKKNLDRSWKIARKEKTQGRDYLERLHLYREGIILEQDLSRDIANKLKKYRNKLVHTSLNSAGQIFFLEMIIRCLLRNKLWNEAYSESTNALISFPWHDNFHHLRAIASFHLGNVKEAVDDTYHAIENELWNFIPIENMMALFFDHLTQREALEFWKLAIGYMIKLNISLEHLGLQYYVDQLLLESDELLVWEESKRKKQNDWKPIFQAMIKGTPATRRLTINILAQYYREQELRSAIIKTFKSTSSKKLKKDLRKLMQSLKKSQKEADIRLLKGLIIKYAISPKREYIVKARQLGFEGEIQLKDILKNSKENPVFRLLCARLMAALKTLNSYEILRVMAASDQYPDNLIAALALREIGLPVSPERAAAKAENLYQYPAFYRLLFGLYCNPLEQEQQISSLLDDPDEMVVLFSAYNCRRSLLSLPSHLKDKANARFSQLMRSTDNKKRTLAILMFWHWDTIAGTFQEKFKYYCKDFDQYGDSLTEALADRTDKKVKFAAVLRMLSSNYFINYTKTAQAKKNRHVIRLAQILTTYAYQKDGPRFIRFWGAVGTSKLDRDKEFWDIVGNRDCDIFIKIGGLCSLFNREIQDTKYWKRVGKFVDLINEAADSKPQTLNQRRWKQLSLFLLSTLNLTLLSTKPVKPILKKHFRDNSDPYLQKTAIASLMWRGDSKDIRSFYQSLNSSDPEIQITSAATLAALIVKNRPKEITKLNQIFKNKSLEVRRSAVLGYYSIVKRQVNPQDTLLSVAGAEINYQDYLKLLRKNARSQWLLPLSAAVVISQEPRYYYEAALIYQKYNKMQQVLILIAKVLPSSRPLPTSGPDFYRMLSILQAEIYLQTGNVDQALQILNQMLKIYPLEADVYYFLCKSYRKLKDKEQFKKFLWLSVLCDIEYVADKLKNMDKTTQLAYLKIIHYRFPLGKKYVVEKFSSLADNKWVKNLEK